MREETEFKTDIPEAVKKLHQHGLQVMGGFIVGFDSDTENIFEQQIRFIQQVGIVTAMVGLLNALPRTRLWRRLQSENRLLQETTGENTDGTLNFIPKMDTATLVAGYRRIIGELYSRRMYYKRIRLFLQDYTPTARSHITRNDILALIQSMLRIGLFSRSNVLYWKLLFKTALTDFRSLPVAIELSICGEHFNKMRNRLLAAGKANSKSAPSLCNQSHTPPAKPET